jgi:hypothetical protein
LSNDQSQRQANSVKGRLTYLTIIRLTVIRTPTPTPEGRHADNATHSSSEIENVIADGNEKRKFGRRVRLESKE